MFGDDDGDDDDEYGTAAAAPRSSSGGGGSKKPASKKKKADLFDDDEEDEEEDDNDMSGMTGGFTMDDDLDDDDDEFDDGDDDELGGDDDDDDDGGGGGDELPIERKARKLDAARDANAAASAAELKAAARADNMEMFHLPTAAEREGEAAGTALPPAALKERIDAIVDVLAVFKDRREPGRARQEYLDQLCDDLAEYYGYLRELIELFMRLFAPAEAVEFLEVRVCEGNEYGAATKQIEPGFRGRPFDASRCHPRRGKEERVFAARSSKKHRTRHHTCHHTCHHERESHGPVDGPSGSSLSSSRRPTSRARWSSAPTRSRRAARISARRS